jgi:hypothetical protein
VESVDCLTIVVRGIERPNLVSVELANLRVSISRYVKGEIAKDLLWVLPWGVGRALTLRAVKKEVLVEAAAKESGCVKVVSEWDIFCFLLQKRNGIIQNAAEKGEAVTRSRRQGGAQKGKTGRKC